VEPGLGKGGGKAFRSRNYTCRVSGPGDLADVCGRLMEQGEEAVGGGSSRHRLCKTSSNKLWCLLHLCSW
jgi:hypothetical protein